jgi:hypothetical protein
MTLNWSTSSNASVLAHGCRVVQALQPTLELGAIDEAGHGIIAARDGERPRAAAPRRRPRSKRDDLALIDVGHGACGRAPPAVAVLAPAAVSNVRTPAALAQLRRARAAPSGGASGGRSLQIAQQSSSRAP